MIGGHEQSNEHAPNNTTADDNIRNDTTLPAKHDSGSRADYEADDKHHVPTTYPKIQRRSSHSDSKDGPSSGHNPPSQQQQRDTGGAPPAPHTKHGHDAKYSRQNHREERDYHHYDNRYTRASEKYYANKERAKKADYRTSDNRDARGSSYRGSAGGGKAGYSKSGHSRSGDADRFKADRRQVGSAKSDTKR